MRSPDKAVLAAALTISITLVATSAVCEEPNMKLTIVNPTGLYDPAPNGYSHAMVVDGASRIVFVAGQGGEDQTGALPPTFADQVKQAYANLRTALGAAGAKPDQVTKVTTYVVNYDPSMLGEMTRNVKATFGEHLPTQTLVPVQRLALDGMLFEVDAVAALD
jgi:enamine deaminase RidA (YjgF/YER057c/UK114 family)